MSAGERPWGEAHRIESARLLCRIGENAVARGDFGDAEAAVEGLSGWVGIDSEDALRFRLAKLLDAKVIDREVARVRDLAEGRRIREHGYRVGDTFVLTHAHPSAGTLV